MKPFKLKNVGWVAFCILMALMVGVLCAALMGAKTIVGVLFFIAVFVVWPCTAISD